MQIKVYSIPLFIILGWRGSPRFEDEPQHNVKGKITIDLLKLLKIKYIILRKDKDLIKLERLKKQKNNDIVACLVEQGTLKNQKKLK